MPSTALAMEQNAVHKLIDLTYPAGNLGGRSGGSRRSGLTGHPAFVVDELGAIRRADAGALDARAVHLAHLSKTGRNCFARDLSAKRRGRT